MQDVKKDRDKYIGGSDIPIIMNLSPFKTRFDLLLEKAGYKDNDFDGNAYTEYGNIMEPKIRAAASLEFGLQFTEGKHINGDIRIHTDGECENTVLEIKTTSQIHEYVDEYKIYLVQLLFYMHQMNAEKGILAVYERPDDFNEELDPERLHLHEININSYSDLIEEILEAVDAFRKDLQKVKENPFIEESDLLPQDITSITQRIIQFEQQLDAMKKIESIIKEEKAKLKKAMEDANVKSWETPNHYKVTVVNDTPPQQITEKYFDETALSEEHPKIYKKYCKTRTVEKKGRSGYVKITAPKNENK